jgi:hypothetical protein
MRVALTSRWADARTAVLDGGTGPAAGVAIQALDHQLRTVSLWASQWLDADRPRTWQPLPTNTFTISCTRMTWPRRSISTMILLWQSYCNNCRSGRAKPSAARLSFHISFLQHKSFPCHDSIGGPSALGPGGCTKSIPSEREGGRISCLDKVTTYDTSCWEGMICLAPSIPYKTFSYLVGCHRCGYV